VFISSLQRRHEGCKLAKRLNRKTLNDKAYMSNIVQTRNKLQLPGRETLNHRVEINTAKQQLIKHDTIRYDGIHVHSTQVYTK